MSEDPKLSQRYRELPREEPPRALDDRILAASRSAVQRRRRWYYGPLAAAAVITLAVAVTLHVQHDRPGEEGDAVSPSMQVQEAPKNEVRRQAPAREARRDAAGPAFVPDPKPAAEPELSSAAKAASADQIPAPAAEVDQRNAVGAISGDVRAQREERSASEAVAAQRAPSPQAAPVPPPASAPAAKPAPSTSGRIATRMMEQATTPERELERIAQLRVEGKHEEADKALAEFRKRYPDYRLSDEMKAKVERR